MLKHQHVIIWARIQNPPGKDDVETVNNWFKELVEKIGMKILLGPSTVYCEMPGNRGMTGVCAIETSHSALHIWDEEAPGTLQLDLYSCSEIDLRIIFGMIDRYAPTEIEYYFLDRDADNSGVCCSSNPHNPCSCSNPNVPKNLKIIDQGRVDYSIAVFA